MVPQPLNAYCCSTTKLFGNDGNVNEVHPWKAYAEIPLIVCVIPLTIAHTKLVQF